MGMNAVSKGYAWFGLVCRRWRLRGRGRGIDGLRLLLEGILIQYIKNKNKRNPPTHSHALAHPPPSKRNERAKKEAIR
jgi:hypothetical protein